MTTADFDAVLTADRPTFGTDEVVDIGRTAFGIHAAAARDLGSERDQTFLLTAPDGTPTAVLKLSNAAERTAVLDMEALAALHAVRVDPALPVAIPRVAPGRTDEDGADARRVAVDRPDGPHHARCYDVLPGRSRISPLDLPDEALAGWGETTARLGVALRGFFHPAAQRTMLWDVQHASRTRVLLDTIRDRRQRDLVTRVLDRFDAVVAPTLPSLRAQIIHGDVTVDNTLSDERGRITGIIDFGDMSHSALVIDLASLLDSVAVDRGPDDILRAARLLVDGYQRITPLEPIELRLLGELWATRAAVTITISSWRSGRGLEDAAFAERYNESVAATIEAILAAGWDRVAASFGAPDATSIDRTRLIERRATALGPAIEPLTYANPIHPVHAEGIWITDADGRRYLDAYNNVPCVGHGHPRVATAIARAARRLNTNLRYLQDEAVELAERLTATCPPGLDTVMYVNSGSEANDLAWRLATTFTGRTGGLCTGRAYHGITAAIGDLSPEIWQDGRRPDHVETWELPDRYRGEPEDPATFEAALRRLVERGRPPAAVIMDGVLTSDGFRLPGPAYVQELVRQTRAAGALWIADEVQGGHGRTGASMWSYQRYGFAPDVVTLGKPMGNGHPVGAVITRREIAARLADETVFFSTFGGNHVSMAAALAVLDVLDDERVLPRVSVAGNVLSDAIWELAARHPVIGDVRGAGLAIGVEIVTDPESRAPDHARAVAIQEGLRERGVLIGTTAAAGNVLKVRPPLAFTQADVPVVIEALTGALVDSASR